ncbi:ABC transporter substrate-binding protein [Novosphingobium humi]|uniref:ABC transporter substrate-binding protein n=1 Tax=Novosphingobium humi TaxID=2282397 RepID=A0ABY7TSA9_9SPHN|nr:ABC transporter substrate-binding protein [Novosphingobium humi]WCT76093.1 ABC transporter substrate-binding protein [Novosphingobium humi]
MRGGLALLGALMVGACSPAMPKVPPSRIISLNPCTDALLVELADRDQIGALSAYSRDPAQSSMDVARARAFPFTRGAMEEVIAAQPSMVVSGSFTPAATRAAYARMGLRLKEFSMASTVEESEAQIRRMAALLGHPDRGEAMIARINRAMRQAAPPPGAKPLPALIWHGGGLVVGGETLVSDLLRRTGFTPFAAIRGMGQSQFLPLERMVVDPPRVLLVIGHGDADGGREGRRVLGHPVLAQLRAMQRFDFDAGLEYCGGPTIVRAAQRLAQIRREAH